RATTARCRRREEGPLRAGEHAATDAGRQRARPLRLLRSSAHRREDAAPDQGANPDQRTWFGMTRWLITGAGGMLGTDLREALERRGDDVVAKARADLDVTDARLVAQCVSEVKPDVIVNCAAWTRVDDAEKNESTAAALNGSAVEL